MRKIAILLSLALGLLTLALITSGPASANQNQALYVAWTMHAQDSTSNPFATPQTNPVIVNGFDYSKSCTNLQIDRYYKIKATYDLIASGTLSSSSQDYKLLDYAGISGNPWRYVMNYSDDCNQTSSPPPSSSQPPSSSTPPSSSAPPSSSTPPTSSTPPSTSTPPRTTTPPASSSTHHKPTSSIPPATHTTTPSKPPLANTGFKTAQIGWFAVVILLVGTGLVFFGTRRGKHV